MKKGIVIGGVVVALIIAGSIAQTMKMSRVAAPAAARPASDCELPEEINAAVLVAMSGSSKEDVRSDLQTMIGCMVPKSGWTGQITNVDGNSIRFEYGTGISAYTVVVLMKDVQGLAPGTSLRCRGRLDGASAKVVSKVLAASPTVPPTNVVEP